MTGPIRHLWLPVLAIVASGCASLSDLLVPAPAAPPARAATVEEEPVLPTRAPQPPPAAKEPAPPAPAKPAPLAKEPPPASAPPTPIPAPPRTATIPRDSPAPVLAPQASAEEEQRIKFQAERRIEGTERLVQKIDPSRLAREQQENYVTIQSFLAKAREALSSRDVQRAFTLADKAFLLADELSKTPR